MCFVEINCSQPEVLIMKWILQRSTIATHRSFNSVNRGKKEEISPFPKLIIWRQTLAHVWNWSIYPNIYLGYLSQICRCAELAFGFCFNFNYSDVHPTICLLTACMHRFWWNMSHSVHSSNWNAIRVCDCSWSSSSNGIWLRHQLKWVTARKSPSSKNVETKRLNRIFTTKWTFQVSKKNSNNG